MRNEYLSAADILQFRDDAWQTYFSHQPYLDLIARKFGQPVVEHIGRMRAIPLRRRLLEPAAASIS